MNWFTTLLLSLPFSLQAQLAQKPYVETVPNAITQGITVQHLDSLYKSAVHMDSSKAVFNTKAASDSLMNAYTKFLQGFGNYLDEHGFKWGQPTRCWNRIYFNRDGTVDYYLFNFKSEPGAEKLKRFKDLFRSYASTHRIGITAPINFAQCSPVTFQDK